jgi:hypothetical protein
MSSSLTGVRLPVRGLRAARDGAADLEQAVAATGCPAVGPPVITLAQSAGSRDYDGEPALGQVANLRVTDGGLTGDLVSMPAWLRDQIAAGAATLTTGRRNVKCQIGHVHPFVVEALVVDVPGVGPIRNMADLRQLVAASKGDEMEDIDAGRFIANHGLIMAAARRGAISPERALQAAADAADGEDVSYIGTLAGVREFSAAARAVPNLSDMVMNVLAGFEVSAHSHQQALRDAHDALDRGHQANYGPDEFSKMFPPSAPLGSDDDPDETGPGAFTPGRKRQVSDIQQRAAAGGHLSDEDLFLSLYGYRPRAGYFDGE